MVVGVGGCMCQSRLETPQSSPPTWSRRKGEKIRSDRLSPHRHRQQHGEQGEEDDASVRDEISEPVGAGVYPRHVELKFHPWGERSGEKWW